MIFILRLVIFSFFIILGFHISVRSIKGRATISIIYGFVLLYYTFLCRVHLIVTVFASDYGHAAETLTTVEKVLQLLRAIFGMQANGNLAGNYREAFVLNCLLFVPLGYLCLLWMICGDSSVLGSPRGTEARHVITDGNSLHVNDAVATSKRRSYLAKIALRTEMICIATFLTIELLPKITNLGMFDINDLFANSIGGGVGIFITLVWILQHVRVGE